MVEEEEDKEDRRRKTTKKTNNKERDDDDENLQRVEIKDLNRKEQKRSKQNIKMEKKLKGKNKGTLNNQNKSWKTPSTK